MKTISLIKEEWLIFQELAILRNLIYSVHKEYGMYIIEADALSLSHLGY